MLLVERMTQHPPQCLYCGRGNVTQDSDDHDQTIRFLDLQREVNWGDSTYLCSVCCEKIAAIVGWEPAEDVAELKERVTELLVKLHDLEAERDQHKRRLETIVAGREAEKEAQAAA